MLRAENLGSCDRRWQLDCQLPSHSCSSSLDLPKSAFLFCFLYIGLHPFYLCFPKLVQFPGVCELQGMSLIHHIWKIIVELLSVQAIYQRFAPGGVVYDACAGWGGRLLGAPLVPQCPTERVSRFIKANLLYWTTCKEQSIAQYLWNIEDTTVL